jgi:hypothetical protein
MRLNFLHLDDALIAQPLLLSAGAGLGARAFDLRDAGPKVRLWARPPALEALRERLLPAFCDARDQSPAVTWLGSGDFHHISALIVGEVAKACAEPLTVIAFDNHPDWVAFPRGLHCGSWVKAILDDGCVDRVIGIGMTSRDLAWPEFKGAGLGHVAAGRLVLFSLIEDTSIVFADYGHGPAHNQHGRKLSWSKVGSDYTSVDADRVLSAIRTEAIYISIDKDVLVESDADTNWDQGGLPLSSLLSWLKVLASRHKVVGVDVVGDRSDPHFEGSVQTRILKRSEILMDHPRRRRDALAASLLNQPTNLQILKTLEDVLC